MILCMMNVWVCCARDNSHVQQTSLGICSGLAYKEELEEAGVPVSVTVFEGQIHTFFNHPGNYLLKKEILQNSYQTTWYLVLGLCKESCMKAYSTIAKFVNEQATHCAARQVPDGD